VRVIAQDLVGDAAGTSDAVTFVASAPMPAPVPGKSITLRTQPVSHGDITVDFPTALNAGRDVTAYTATCTSATGKAAVASAPTSPIIVPTSEDGRYTCVVAAANSAGTSSTAGSDAISAPVLVGAPASAPRNITMGANGGLAWDVPNYTANVSVTYSVDYREATGGTWVSLGTVGVTSLAPAAMPVLERGVAYEFRVSAANEIGDESTRASATLAYATSSGPPVAPTGVTATRASSSGVQISWTRSRDGGRPLTSNEVACLSISEGEPRVVSAPATATSAIVAVAGAKNYECSVAAVNSLGRSESRSVGALSTDAPAWVVGGAAPSGLRVNRVLEGCGWFCLRFNSYLGWDDDGARLAQLSTATYTAYISRNGGRSWSPGPSDVFGGLRRWLGSTSIPASSIPSGAQVRITTQIGGKEGLPSAAIKMP